MTTITWESSIGDIYGEVFVDESKHEVRMEVMSLLDQEWRTFGQQPPTKVGGLWCKPQV